ncbi:MAG TPA: hypothetical protein DCF49_03500 [Lachnospiraceae bacterium]|nr:hypothetical protein [Lachnospiraceae bacterium]
MKRALFGSIMTVITIVAAVVGLINYITNSNTNYFAGLGKDPVVIGCALLAIAALALWLVLGNPKAAWTDILPVAAPVLLIVAALTLVNSRINGVAAIMTFENNAQNMADLQSAIVAIAALVAAAVLAALNAFFDVKKEA